MFEIIFSWCQIAVTIALTIAVLTIILGLTFAFIKGMAKPNSVKRKK